MLKIASFLIIIKEVIELKSVTFFWALNYKKHKHGMGFQLGITKDNVSGVLLDKVSGGARFMSPRTLGCRGELLMLPFSTR